VTVPPGPSSADRGEGAE